MMRVLDIFSGIGGFSLGLERTGGFRTVAFCEIDPFCRKVLAKHWPEVPQYDDIQNLTADRLCSDGISVDVICGGFPCQDISSAGNRRGIDGERSGLWKEYARLIGEIRPNIVIVENVAALLDRGIGRVLGDLATLGFNAEWHCIPASAVGAPHRRDRVWIVAYPARQDDGSTEAEPGIRQVQQPRICAVPSDVAHADRAGLEDGRSSGKPARPHEIGSQLAFPEFERCGGSWWSSEPDMDRMAHGIPCRVDRLRSLGNAVVPQVVEAIGRAILAGVSP